MRILLFFFLSISLSCALKSVAREKIKETTSQRNMSSLNGDVRISLIPQELYYETILNLLNGVNHTTKIIRILQFTFFTDNPGNSLPKQIATKIVSLKKQYPNLDIEILMESQKDLDRTDGKGAAQRNAITKLFFEQNGIRTFDVFGLDQSQTPTKKPGVSHAKVIVVDDTVLAGSTNLTQQSTTVAANNEMNLLISSPKIAKTILKFVTKIKANGSQMHALEQYDGSVEVFTDTLLFDKLTALIDKTTAGEALDISMYQFLYRDDRDVQAKILYEKLVAAKSRGAKIRVYLEKTKNTDDITTKANARVAGLLSENGIDVYFDPTTKISHSKFMIYMGLKEKIVILGSSNYYRGDFNENHQINWQIKNVPLIDSLKMYFDQKIAYEGQKYEEAIGKAETKKCFDFGGVSDRTEWYLKI